MLLGAVYHLSGSAGLSFLSFGPLHVIIVVPWIHTSLLGANRGEEGNDGYGWGNPQGKIEVVGGGEESITQIYQQQQQQQQWPLASNSQRVDMPRRAIRASGSTPREVKEGLSWAWRPVNRTRSSVSGGSVLLSYYYYCYYNYNYYFLFWICSIELLQCGLLILDFSLLVVQSILSVEIDILIP